MTALDRIEELAKKADPDTWKHHAEVFSVNDSLLISALSPEVVLAMVEALRLLPLAKDALGDWEDGTNEQHTHYCPNCDNSIDGNRKVRDAIDAALSKLEQMK